MRFDASSRFYTNCTGTATTLEPVRPIELSEIRAARERIAKTIVMQRHDWRTGDWEFPADPSEAGEPATDDRQRGGGAANAVAGPPAQG